MSKFIPTEQFQMVVNYSPLSSIDLIVKYKDEILLGKRINRPAKDFYFTVGGIVRKNETFKEAIKRIAKEELCIEYEIEPNFIGIFEHFYEDSIYENITTHYINHGYVLEVDEKLENLPTEQHNKYMWIKVKDLIKSEDVHKYVKLYFKHIII